MRHSPRPAPIRLLVALLLLLGMLLPDERQAGSAAAAAALPPVLRLATMQLGNRFAAGQPVIARFSLRNPNPLSHTYLRTESIADYFGAATALLTDTVTLAGYAIVQDTLPLPIHRQGYFALSMALQDQAGGQQAAATLPIVVLDPQAPTLDRAAAFGVAGTLTTSFGGDPRQLAAAAAAMTAAGITYDREELDWGAIEPRPGSGLFRLTAIDNAIVAAHNAGVQVLGLLDYWGGLPQPETATAGTPAGRVTRIVGCRRPDGACAYTPQGDALFAVYAAAMARRYKPGGDLARERGWTDGYGIAAWEVWNEPSTPDFWRHDLSDYPARFAALYTATAAAIRAAQPRAQVMYDESGHAIDTAMAEAGASADVLAVHSYTGAIDPDAALLSPRLPRGGHGTALAALSALAANGPPIWVTETGFATDGTVTPQQQAQYLVRSYVNLLAQGVRKSFWFKLREDPSRSFGLLTPDGQPKPAYAAYAAMTRHLRDSRFAAAVQLGAALRADLFTAPGNTTVAVLWGVGEPGTLLLPAGTGQARADDMMGNPLGVTSDGLLKLPISGDPVYLTLPDSTPLGLATMLGTARIEGISPLGVEVDQAAGLVNSLPDLEVTLSARTNVPISGTVTLALPTGWTAPITASTFPALLPGQSYTLRYGLTSVVSHPGDTIVATGNAVIGATAPLSFTVPISTTMPISATVQPTTTTPVTATTPITGTTPVTTTIPLTGSTPITTTPFGTTTPIAATTPITGSAPLTGTVPISQTATPTGTIMPTATPTPIVSSTPLTGTATITATVPLTATVPGALPIIQYLLTYGHPRIDGSLATWTGASEADLIDLAPNQIFEIPGWTPRDLSGRIYTMWDENYFYLAADVRDAHLNLSPAGFQANSLLLGWGMDPDAYLLDAGKNRFTMPFGLTNHGTASFQSSLFGPLPYAREAIRYDPATRHLIYTTAMPWRRLGGYRPRPGGQFAFNLLIRQVQRFGRTGWITFAPGLGTGVHPSQWPLWTLEQSGPVAGLRIGGFTAPPQGSLTFRLPAPHGQLVIHDGGMSAITVTINGAALNLSAGPGAAGFARFVDTRIAISSYVHTGINAVTVSGVPSSRAGTAVLSFFQ